MMKIFRDYPFLVFLLGIIVTELIKIGVFSIKNKRLALDHFSHSGGMPSGHSSLVGILVGIVYMLKGVSSIEFVLVLGVAFIVLYDSMNIRRETGKHARFLNELQKNIKFKEPLGHTFLEVFLGFLFGIIFSVISLSLI